MIYSAALLLATAYLNIAVLDNLSQLAVAPHLIYAVIIYHFGRFWKSALQSVQDVEHQDFIQEKAEHATQQNQLS